MLGHSCHRCLIVCPGDRLFFEPREEDVERNALPENLPQNVGFVGRDRVGELGQEPFTVGRKPPCGNKERITVPARRFERSYGTGRRQSGNQPGDKFGTGGVGSGQGTLYYPFETGARATSFNAPRTASSARSIGMLMMARPKAMVIITGDSETDPTRYRRLFLRAVQLATPAVLKTLHDDLLPLYAGRSLFWAGSTRLGFVKGALKAPAAELDAFRSQLKRWASRFNLNEEWIREVAVLTLEQWKTSTEVPIALNWADLPFAPPPLPLEDREVEFRHPGWAVERES